MSYLVVNGYSGHSVSYRFQGNPPDAEDDELDEDVKNDPVPEEDDAETAPEPPVEEDAG